MPSIFIRLIVLLLITSGHLTSGLSFPSTVEEGSGLGSSEPVSQPFSTPPPEGVESEGEEEDCISGPSWWYRGTRNRTSQGIECQRWDTDKPHIVRYKPGEDDINHNYCRNPDRDVSGTWCYTTNENLRWDYCQIPKCHDDSVVIWTSYYPESENSEIASMLAEQELLVQKQAQGAETFKTIAPSRQSDTEYWSLVGDYKGKRIFFTDYKSEMIGVVDLETNLTTTHYHGMAHGIEGLAYDWLRGSLYWTDSALMWIMVTDDSFRHYATVYRSQNPLYGLSIHVRTRTLYFSTYKMLGSRISSVDLAGQNERVLLQFPKVYDVTGLTVDYADDRIYWSDYNGSGGVVASCDLQGADVRQHFSRTASQFWGVASYLDFLFITDVYPQVTSDLSELYLMWVVRKEFSYNDKATQLSLHGKPRGISLYSGNDQSLLHQDEEMGSCEEMPKCEHLCLPRPNATRHCVCSMGYHKQNDTHCRPVLIPDEYLLILDAGQGLVFQLPLNQSDRDFYSIVPLADDTRISLMKVGLRDGDIYWSDAHSFAPRLHRSSLGGALAQPLLSNVTLRLMERDPLSGNVYYVDEDSQDIVMVAIGTAGEEDHVYKTIVRGTQIGHSQADVVNPIKKLAVDVKNKLLYWTTSGVDKQGRLWRSQLNGEERAAVLSNLNWPTALAIDYERGSLFVADGKIPKIYEIGLDTASQLPADGEYRPKKTYDVSLYDTERQIIDMKVHGDVVYYVDNQMNQIQTYRLVHDDGELAGWGTAGPADFFDITAIEIYSSRYYAENIADVGDPCASVLPACEHLCAAVSQTERRCACGDGYELVKGYQCIENEEFDFNMPPYTFSCPEDMVFNVLPCQDTVRVEWTPPTWFDDTTDSDKLIVTQPLHTPPASFKPGIHFVEYFARDEHGIEGVCFFSVDVQKSDCGVPPSLPDFLEATELVCNNDLLSYVISCVDGGTVSAWSSGLLGRTLTNICFGPTGLWAIRDFSIYQCVDVPMETTSTTTTTTTTVGVLTTTSGVKDIGSKSLTNETAATTAAPATTTPLTTTAPTTTATTTTPATTAIPTTTTTQQPTTTTEAPEATTTTTETGAEATAAAATTAELSTATITTTTRQQSAAPTTTTTQKEDESNKDADGEFSEKHVKEAEGHMIRMIIVICSIGALIICVILIFVLRRRRCCRSWKTIPLLDVKVLWRRRGEERAADDVAGDVDSSAAYAKMS